MNEDQRLLTRIVIHTALTCFAGGLVYFGLAWVMREQIQAGYEAYADLGTAAYLRGMLEGPILLFSVASLALGWGFCWSVERVIGVSGDWVLVPTIAAASLAICVALVGNVALSSPPLDNMWIILCWSGSVAVIAAGIRAKATG